MALSSHQTDNSKLKRRYYIIIGIERIQHLINDRLDRLDNCETCIGILI